MNRTCYVFVAGGVMCLYGCAPKGIEDGLAFYADQYHVRDAAARRSHNYWFLRFDALILSDLDDAIQAGQKSQPEEMKRLGIQAVRAAASLAQEVDDREIDRLPAGGRVQLAKVAQQPADAAKLKQIVQEQAAGQSSTLLAELEASDNARLLKRLTEIRRGVEALPDDKGRAGRQLLFALGAAPAWAGVESIEQNSMQRVEKCAPFERGVTFAPSEYDSDELLARFAPTIVIESPESRGYPADCDRFGEVYLTGDPTRVDVHVNTSKPTAYAYRSEAKINGKRYPQLVYVWWFPERPSMTQNDPAAGRIDGDTLRITFDSQDRPAVFEVVQGCGCGHLVYVSESLEKMALEQFKQAEAGKQLAVERDVGDKRDIIVSGSVNVPEADARPMVYVVAGYHAITGLQCGRAALAPTTENYTYQIARYDRLDRLPLGDGFGSMFGADGLVHNAGRREGYLLAPTGILSAGQPRKRGTQKIRWDEYMFDDPRLLEKALRLPSGF